VTAPTRIYPLSLPDALPIPAVNEDSGAASVSNFATAITAGPNEDATQTVAFVVTNNSNSGLFTTQPAISPTGTLTYTPAADANGTATHTAKLHANGDTANGL